MLHFEQTIDCPAGRFAAFGVPAEQVLFFDIETTGFSPESSYVYLIGCAFVKDGAVKLRQWFLDDVSQEKELVREFGVFSGSFRLLVHYNGSTFDLPYLQKKAHRHRLFGIGFGEGAVLGSLPEGKAMQQSFDIYKSLLPYKKLLGQKDLKQRTVEQFCGISREDAFCGGDLIPVYTEFVGRYRYECLTHGNPFQEEKTCPEKNDEQEPGSRQVLPNQDARTKASAQPAPDFTGTGLTKMPESPAKALLYVLLLHNREDITGLLAISELLALRGLLSGEFSVAEISAKDRASSSASMTPHKTLRLDPNLPPSLLSACFSAAITKQLPEETFPKDACPASISLSAADPSGSLRLFVPVLFGTFKYFFEDYKDYYYLPMEDCAMHKSVAQFVAKEYRKKATKETCYQKKEGLFLPQPEEIVTPALRLHAKDRFSYFENTENALSDPTTLKNWARALLGWLFA